MRFVWSEKQKAFLKKEASNRTTDELKIMIANEFNVDLSNRQIESAKYRFGIKSYKKRGQYREIFTDEIRSFVSLNHKKKSTKEMSNLLKKVFDVNFTEIQIRNFYNDNNLTSEVDTKFGKGSEHFKYKNIGEERIDSRKRVWIKIGEKKWKLKSHVVYETANGSIADDQVLIYIDRDPSNWHLENLAICELNAKNSVISKLKIDNKEVTKALITKARVDTKIKSIERGKK